jgi:hypothetical protein
VGSRPDQLPRPPRVVLVNPYQLLGRKNPRRHEGSFPVSKSGLTPGAEDVLEWEGIMGREVGKGGGGGGAGRRFAETPPSSDSERLRHPFVPRLPRDASEDDVARSTPSKRHRDT